MELDRQGASVLLNKVAAAEKLLASTSKGAISVSAEEAEVLANGTRAEIFLLAHGWVVIRFTDGSLQAEKRIPETLSIKSLDDGLAIMEVSFAQRGIKTVGDLLKLSRSAFAELVGPEKAHKIHSVLATHHYVMAP